MAQQLSNYLVPAVLCGIFTWALLAGVPVFETFLQGAKEGIGTSLRILPAILALMTAIGMINASGALDVLCHAARPLADALGIPVDILPLAMLRPVSGSGAMVLFQDLLVRFGPDSTIGRIASVLEGSTETTFYTIAVYYGATRVSHTRHTLPAALAGDLLGLLMSILTVRWFFGN